MARTKQTTTVVENETKKGNNTMKKWNEMTENEQFLQTWKNIMTSLCKAEICHTEKLEDNFFFFSRTEVTMKVLNVMMMKGLFQSYTPKFGLKTITYKKDGKEVTSTIPTIIAINVLGINRNAENGKYLKNFEYLERYLLPAGFTPNMADRFKEDDAFKEFIRQQIAEQMKEKIAVSDMTTAELNHPVEELVK